MGTCMYTSWIFVQTGHLTTGAASFRILEIRGGEGRVGRWATGRSLLANRRSCACTWSVLGWPRQDASDAHCACLRSYWRRWRR